MSDNKVEALWHWAVAAYGQGTNKAALIDLQDRFDLNVNILLWCCWCANAGRQLQRMEILGAMEIADHWSTRITGPLREARRGTGLIPARLRAPATDALYEEIKKIELAAEKMELTMLAQLPSLEDLDLEPGAHARTTEQCRDISRRNVMGYLAEMGTVRYQNFSISPIEALLAAIFPADDGQPCAYRTNQ